MSRILDLAKTFKETSKVEANSIDQELRNDLNKLKQSLQQQVSESEHILKIAIQSHANKMSWILFRGWIIALAFLITALAILTFWITWKGMTIMEQLQEIQEHQKTLTLMKQYTKGVQITECIDNGTPKPCAMIDLKAEQQGLRWGKHQEYLLLKVK